jgi:uncharacterized protein (TIGR03437 family)
VGINLVYELARTEVRDAQNRFTKAISAGYAISVGSSSSISQASALLASAQAHQQAGDESSAAKDSYGALTNAIQAREQVTFEVAQQDIEKTRKSEVTVVVQDQNGKPVSGARIDYRQISHDFIFSIGWPLASLTPSIQSSQVTAFHNAGFESGVVEAWWGEVERSDGVYSFPDSWVAQLAAAGIATAMHTSIWPSPGYLVGMPAYAYSLSPVDLAGSAYRYSNQLNSRYQNRLSIYSAFNEPDLDQAYRFSLTDLINVVTSSAPGAKQANPSQRIYVNIGKPILGDLNSVHYEAALDSSGKTLPAFPTPVESGLDFAQQLIDSGSDANTIGLESYYGAGPLPPFDLGLFHDTLQRYSLLGNKLFLSELAYATLDDYPNLNPSWKKYLGWHQGYTDQTQADWARGTLTIAFSKPYISGIDWISGNDGPGLEVGLFHKDQVTPRPALGVIQQLFNSWTTSGTGQTGSDGTLYFRGFGGTYDIAVTDSFGRVWNNQAHVPEGQVTTLTTVVAPTAALSVSTNTVQLTYSVRGAIPAQAISIQNTGGTPAGWTATTTSSWLTLSQQSGTAPSTLTISVNPVGVSPGAYSGTVSLASPGLQPLQISVALRVLPVTLILDNSNLTFEAHTGGPVPQAQNVLLSSNGPGIVFAIGASGGASWLSVTASCNTTPCSLGVSVTPDGLPAGVYSGNVNISGVGAADPISLNVTLTVQDSAPTITSVVNGASFQPSIQNGSWITIQGTGLSTTTRTWNSTDILDGQLPQSLDGVKVSINGKSAVVSYISPSQINLLAPVDSTTGTIQVAVTNVNGSSPPFSVQMQAYSPAWFMLGAPGGKYLAATHADGSIVGPVGLYGATVSTQPAKPGETIILYGTGFGATTTPVPTDQVFSGAALLAASESITIGGVVANAQFAGESANGLYQFNVVVPDLATGDQPVTARISNSQTQGNAFVFVQR